MKNTINSIKNKNMSKEAMKSLIRCCITIASQKAGRDIGADELMSLANSKYPHDDFQKAVLGAPVNETKVAYVATGLILLLEKHGYEATTIHHIFEVCKIRNDSSNGGNKRLIDEHKPKSQSEGWRPLDI